MNSVIQEHSGAVSSEARKPRNFWKAAARTALWGTAAVASVAAVSTAVDSVRHLATGVDVSQKAHLEDKTGLVAPADLAVEYLEASEESLTGSAGLGLAGITGLIAVGAVIGATSTALEER